jgi:hypothetical protein
MGRILLFQTFSRPYFLMNLLDGAEDLDTDSERRKVEAHQVLGEHVVSFGQAVLCATSLREYRLSGPALFLRCRAAHYRSPPQRLVALFRQFTNDDQFPFGLV